MIAAARDNVAFKLTQEIHSDIVTTTALIQALQRLGFEFPVGNGVIKKCGVDFLTMEVPEAARVKKLSIRHKAKGLGKKSKSPRPSQTPEDEESNPEHNPEVLDIKVSKSETEDLCADNNNGAKAGKSERLIKFKAQRRKREEIKKNEEKTRKKEREQAGNKQGKWRKKPVKRQTPPSKKPETTQKRTGSDSSLQRAPQKLMKHLEK